MRGIFITIQPRMLCYNSANYNRRVTNLLKSNFICWFI